jgi:hypothetical protein
MSRESVWPFCLFLFLFLFYIFICKCVQGLEVSIMWMIVGKGSLRVDNVDTWELFHILASLLRGACSV